MKYRFPSLTTISLDMQLDSHNGQPLVAPHHPRLQLPGIFGSGNHLTLAQRACRRRQMDIPLSRECRCHVQLRLVIRVCRTALPCRAHTYRRAAQLSRIRRSLPAHEVHQVLHTGTGQGNSTDIPAQGVLGRQQFQVLSRLRKQPF